MSEYWRVIECFAAKASRRDVSLPKTATMRDSELAVMALAKTSEICAEFRSVTPSLFVKIT